MLLVIKLSVNAMSRAGGEHEKDVKRIKVRYGATSSCYRNFSFEADPYSTGGTVGTKHRRGKKRTPF